MGLDKELRKQRMNEKPRPANTLIIFIEVPENVTFYLVPRLANKEMLDEARAVNRMYMNADEFTKKQERHFEAFSNWAVSAEGKTCIVETPIMARITEVLEIGFAL